jgi:two-component system response regulator MtrA
VNARVLLVEDDPSVRRSTALLLEHDGFEVEAVADGRAALDHLAGHPVDLVVLDLMLPGVDGLEVCRQIRRTSRLPIVMLTARSDVTDVVVGLELGADDYVTKPFEAKELAARLRAVLRRAVSEPDTPVVRAGPIEIDAAAFRATCDGRPVDVTATEFRLLLELARHAGQVLTRDVLLDRVWGYDYLGDSRLVDMAIKRLRDKLDSAGAPRRISTVRGVGYRFEVG